MDAPRVQRVAIVGCGYVGAALGEALVRAGCDVAGTTTRSERADELTARGIRSVLLELTDTQRMHDLLADRQAAYLTVAPSQRGAGYRDVYLAGAAALVNASADTPVHRFIYTSSTRVYGQDDGSWVDESSPTEPADENGRILLEAERTLLDGIAQRSAPVGEGGRATATVVRLAGIYGPGRDPAARIRAQAGSRRSDGDAFVNMVHLEDIVVALRSLLDVDYHGVLNLADDAPLTRRAYYDRVLESAGLPPVDWHSPPADAPRGKRVNNRRLKEVLGLTLRHPSH